jgi:hypothetical protein
MTGEISMVVKDVLLSMLFTLHGFVWLFASHNSYRKQGLFFSPDSWLLWWYRHIIYFHVCLFKEGNAFRRYFAYMVVSPSLDMLDNICSLDCIQEVHTILPWTLRWFLMVDHFIHAICWFKRTSWTMLAFSVLSLNRTICVRFLKQYVEITVDHQGVNLWWKGSRLVSTAFNFSLSDNFRTMVLCQIFII